MKNLSKLLCAVLVLALLCSSLMFMVGAEEETPAYTSVEASFASMLDLKYNAEDNLIISITRPTATANGWNGEGARQAHIVTNTATGESWYREWFEGDKFLLAGGEPANAGGNEYIQYNFTKQTLTYEEGFHEYIIVDMDLAYKAKTATIWDKTKYVSTSNMKQEVIGRSSAGTSWATVQNYKDFGLGDGFKHVTSVYDYTSGNAYIFVNGKLATTYANGALTAAVKNAYLSGTNVEVSEWRIGSNSADEMNIANPYVRYTKMANAEDTLATAISSGDLSAWGANIYDSNYVIPTPYWFVKTADHAVVENYINKINDTTATVIDNTVAGNYYAGSSTSIGNGVDTLGAMQTVAEDLTYVTFYAPNDGKIDKKNVFWQFNTVNAPNVSIAAGSSAYYVVDFDIATHGQALPYIDISVMLRRVSDGGGFPFSPNVDVAPYINPNGEWNHVTIVGDLGANKCHVYVNGEYAATLDYAYNASQISGNTELSPKGIRVDLGLSAETYDLKAGQNIALDNFAERVYTDAASSNGLAAAVAQGSLNGWANHTNGNAGRALPVIATVNGVAYNNSTKLATALVSNEKLNVEFFSLPFIPATLQATATIKTNGFDMAKLFTLAPSCEILTNENGVITTYAPFAENRVVEQAFTTGGSAIPSVLNAIKYNNPSNLLYTFTPISLQVGGAYQPTWGQPGFRNGELVTNTDTGDIFYRESAITLPDGTMADGVVLDANNNVVSFKEADKGSNTFVRSNEYVNFYFTKQKLTYEAGKNEYIVVDFDFGTDDVIAEDGIAVQLIPRTSSGAWASDIYLADLPIAPGEMAHVTIVFDYTTNNGHVFVNGAYCYTVAEAAMDGEHSGGRTDGNKWAEQYLQGTEFTIQEFKLGSDRKTSTVCFDNVCIRAYDLSASSDPIAAAVAAGDITTWADSIYNDKYVTSKFPAVASVDGVDYGTVEALNAALAVETDTVKEVYLKHTPKATIAVKTDANVETNGLVCDFDYETGLYQFHHDDPYYVCTGTDYAYASNRLVLAHEDSSTVYSFTTINKDNCQLYATPVLWFSSLEPEVVEVVYYVFGDQIKPLNDEAYIEDGKLIANEWKAMDVEFNVGDVVATFPVSNKTLGETWYLLGAGTKDAPFAATDIKQSANVSSNVQFTVYVNKSETVSSGNVTVIDGVEYVTYTFEFAPHQINEKFSVEFMVTDENGREYLQRQNVSFVDYAEGLLTDANQSADVKDLVASILAYSNEAHKLFKGETISEVDALLASYAAPTVTPGETHDTAELSEVIRAAAMKLNSAPEFVFKVARGFKGTLTFAYTGVNGEVVVEKTVDATECEQYVVLDGFDVCDINADITITATKDGADTSVTGTYNLSTYAAGLENPAFANALLAYAQVAKEYKVKYALYVGGKFNVTDATVASEVLKSIASDKIKQFDQTTDLNANPTDDYYSGSNGTPRFVTVAGMNGNVTEALYFSRSREWLSGSQNYGWSEFRFNTNNSKITSITFNYVVNGSTEKCPASQTKAYYGESDASAIDKSSYVELKIGNGYYQCKNSEMIVDGEWHSMTIDLGEGANLANVLVKLYHFQGEMLISDVVFTYAQ